MKRAMLKQYSILIDFLGRVLGPDYEIALHDLSDISNSIVAIANGHISGRTIGAPLTSLALKMVADKSYYQEDYRINYSGLTNGNKVLRSSTMFIKDDLGKLSGMLCINFDDSRYQELSTKVLQLCHPDQFVEHNILVRNDIIDEDGTPQIVGAELFPNSIASIMENVIHDVVQEDGVPADRLTQEEKIKILGLLDQKGIFLLKGAVNYVAKELHSSQASIYRYLAKVDRQKDK
ncbi:MAG TPA: PAS domain-containing protein [Anaerovoracaceae bacterium]|nr:PAS domain-containing protein [Anaerovoracaceae bacterium]